MIQLFGQSVALDSSPAEEIASSPDGMRSLPAQAGDGQRRCTPVLRHALEVRWRLALALAVGFAALAAAYFLAEALVLKAWPAYRAQSIVSVQPVAGKDPPKGGAQPGVAFGGDAVEASIQRQMTNVSGQDVLASALHRLTGFRHAGESQQAAEQRLVRALEVTRPGPAEQFSIRARAETPAMAAQIANAAAAASVESAQRDEQTGKAQRQQIWREERDRIHDELAADLAEQTALKKQKGVVAGGASVARLERLGELEAEINRLKGRVAAVDEQWIDLALEESAAGVTYQVTPAVAPQGRSRSGVLRNSALIGAAGLFFGVLAVVGFVMNRANLKRVDGLFMASNEAVEEDLAAEGGDAAGRAAENAAGRADELAEVLGEGQNPLLAESPSGRETVNSVFSAGSLPVATPAGNAEAPEPAVDCGQARLWTARRNSPDQATLPVEVDFSAELRRLMTAGKQFANPWPGQGPGQGPGQEPGLQGAGLKEAPRAEASLAPLAPRSERAPRRGPAAEADNRSARMDALRSLIVAMAAKNSSGTNRTTERQDG
jgi:hypothetical protein